MANNLPTPSRRIAATALIAFGVWVILLTPLYSLARRTSAARFVNNEFRYVFTPSYQAALERDWTDLRGLGLQFIEGARPDLAHKLGLSQANFDAFTSQHFPAVAAGVSELPGAVQLVDPVIPQLRQVADSGDFHKVDSIPGLGLPIDSVPWLLYALGAGALGLGLLALRGGGRLWIGAGLTLTAATVVAAFALQLPAKFQATSRVVPVARVAVSRLAADTATRTVAVVNAMVPQVEQQMVPAVAARLHESPAALVSYIDTHYPQVARGLARWPQIEPGAAELAARQEASVKRFAEGDGAPFSTLPWLLIVPAALAAVLCGVALSPRAVAQRELVTS
jgi:hypothetical protein